jgi:hypothetical protein
VYKPPAVPPPVFDASLDDSQWAAWLQTRSPGSLPAHTVLVDKNYVGWIGWPEEVRRVSFSFLF